MTQLGNTKTPDERTNSATLIDELIVNMKSLAGSQVGDKLCITADGKYVLRDERMLQSLVRYLTGDSRERLMDFIEHIIHDLSESLKDKKLDAWKRDKLIQLMPLTLVGLENIESTYRADKIILFRLENLVDALRQLLNHHHHYSQNN